MTPLSSKEKGDLVVAEAIRHYTRSRSQILLPLGDKQKYDLVIDRVGLLKVQCKYTSVKRPSGSFEVMMVVNGGNRSRKTSARYVEGDFDLLFVLTSDGVIYEIPAAKVMGLKKSVTLSAEYDQFKL